MATAGPSVAIPSCFEVIDTPDGVKYNCNLCPGARLFNDYIRHAKQPGHKKQVSLRSAPPRTQPVVDSGAVVAEMLEESLPVFTNRLHQPGSGLADAAISHLEPVPSHLTDISTNNYSGLFTPIGRAANPPNDLPESEQRKIKETEIWQVLQGIESDAGSEDSPSNSDEPEDADNIGFTQDINEEWYPFKKKEHLVGLLLMGSGRKLLSRSQYETIRVILQLVKVSVPEWGVMRTIRERLKSRFSIRVKDSISSLGNKCYRLSVQEIISEELANPHVVSEMEFYPVYDPAARLNRLAQSSKWLHGFSRHLRVQMVRSCNLHYFIYEPLQLRSNAVVVPIFFFTSGTSTFAKCLPATLAKHAGTNLITITIDAEPAFESNLYQTVDISTFWRCFHDIKFGDGSYLKDLCGNKLYQRNHTGEQSEVTLPNPWREKSGGKLIRHVPITLYSDDTSGNVSKKWNKHMCLYFTLCGLRPALTDDEFNIHFLATSNTANALELFDPVVDELNQLARTGFVAYDHSVDQDVYVMVVALCHLGDSPMHAEISNTHNPATSLHSCRICSLSVQGMADKSTAKYIGDFVGVNSAGEQARLPLRDWAETRHQSEEMWTLLKKRGNKGRSEAVGKKYGVRDTINEDFCRRIKTLHSDPLKSAADVELQFDEWNSQYGERLFNPFFRLEGFNGHFDTPIETLHVFLLGIVKYLYREEMKEPDHELLIGRWKSFNTSGLNIGPIQPKALVQHCNNLNGKEFKIVVQGAPFVLFPSLSKEKREMWTTLCHLCALIFQPEIEDLEVYLAEVRVLVNRFLSQVINITAQWANKPKFHMLIHLEFSIRRFGPLNLLATQKFESQNGVTRIASTHSNRHNPGRDIAMAFANGRLVRVILSGAQFEDRARHGRFQASATVRAVFKDHRVVQKALGFNPKAEPACQITVKGRRAKSHQPIEVPSDLAEAWPDREWTSAEALVLRDGQNVKDGYFVLAEKYIACVIGIWNSHHPSGDKCRVKLQDICCVLNIQHNCNGSGCTVVGAKPGNQQARKHAQQVFQVTHEETNSYIINSAALYSARIHRELANLVWEDVAREEWVSSIQVGLERWKGGVADKNKKDMARSAKRVKQSELAECEEQSQLGDYSGHYDPNLMQCL